VTPAPDALPADIDARRAALAAERLARREAEARAAGAEGLDQWSKRWRISLNYAARVLPPQLPVLDA
jgi:hypothetical protein